jgi:hypothetical protein
VGSNDNEGAKVEKIFWYTCECGHSAGYMPFGHMSRVTWTKCDGIVTRHVYAKIPGLSESMGSAKR